jgi:hypothetical protein
MFRWRFVTLAAVFATVIGAAPAAQAGCGDYNQDGGVSATDALGVLASAVGTQTCARVRCDVDSSGGVSATDALRVLRLAVGQISSVSCPAVAVETIGDLPLATGPVGGGAGGLALVAGIGGTTPSGIDLGSLGPDTFGPESSRAACETSNMVKNAVQAAAQGDLILCYVQNVFESNPEVGIDIYDGNVHVFALEFGEPPPGSDPEDQGGPSSVSLRITREGSFITDFEMFSCEERDGVTAQAEYLRQSIDGPDFSMLSKNLRNSPSGDESVQIEVSAGFGDDGTFVGEKLVTVAHDRDEAEFGTNFGEMTVGQSEDTFSLDGYDVGSFTHPEWGTGTYGRELRSEASLLDFNEEGSSYDIGLLAIGHGAARAHLSGSDGFGSWDEVQVEGWNGDTTLVDETAAADFIASVTSATLVTPASGVSVSFGEGETFDCATPTEATVLVDMQLLDERCSHLSLSHEWIACHQITDDGAEPPCEGPECPCEGPECPPPCEGPECPCEGPTCGPMGECWDPSCTCDPFTDDGCIEACWDFENCGNSCWSPVCTCTPDEPGCVDGCWDDERCGPF